MSGKPLVLGVCALLVSLGAAGQVNTKVKPSQHTPFPTSKSSTTGLIFNRVLKSTSISWGEPMVFEAAGNADIDAVPLWRRVQFRSKHVPAATDV